MNYEEHVEQVKFVQRVLHTRQDLIIYAIPNGGKRNPREAIRLKAEGVLPGIPDLAIAEPIGPYHGCYIEMKTKKGKVSGDQNSLMIKLESKGYKCYVARSCEQAWAILEAYLALGDG